jgi:hypothetical protein
MALHTGADVSFDFHAQTAKYSNVRQSDRIEHTHISRTRIMQSVREMCACSMTVDGRVQYPECD